MDVLLLKEDGDLLLAESGDFLEITATGAALLLKEDGDILLSEDSFGIYLEHEDANTFDTPQFFRFGGLLDVRVEIDSADAGSGDLWGTGTWDEGVWSSLDPNWQDITDYVMSASITQGAERWGERFVAGTATVLVDNTTGVFTPESGETLFLQPYQPGRRLRIVCVPHPDDPDTKVPLFTGEIDASTDSYDDAGFNISTSIECVDFMATWAGYNPPASAATGVQTTDARVEAALDLLGWDDDERDIQVGDHTMQSSFLAQSTLEEAAKAAEAEGGAFFCSKDGLATFRARDWLITDERSVATQGYLGYDEGDVPEGEMSNPVVEVETSWERARIVNQVQFARVGSTMQEVEDLDSQAQYGVRSYQRTDLANNSDAEVLVLAERHLAANKDNRLRLNSITIIPREDPDEEGLNTLIYDSEIGDLLQVNVEPPWGWSYDRQVNITGIHHEITAEDWEVTFRLDDSPLNFLAGRDVLMTQMAPLAWWKMSESGGTTTTDSSGNGHGLTWAGSPTLASSGGPIPGTDGMVTVDGTDDVATVTSEAALELTSDMSIEMWVKADDASGSGQTLISCRASGDPLYELFYMPDDNWFKFFPTTSAGAGMVSGGTYLHNEWHHVVVTINWPGSTRLIRIYVNGVQQASSSVSYLPAPSSPVINIARRAIGNDLHFDGDISEIAIFDRVLSSSEVLDLYNATYE